MKKWSLRNLEWDSGILQTPCGLLSFCEEVEGQPSIGESRVILLEALSEARCRGIRFLTVKPKAEDNTLVNACLAEQGLLVDTELTFFKHAHNRRPARTLREGIRTEKLDSFWDDSLFGLASTLQHSRFFRDSNIPWGTAERLWKESIKNSCGGRASYSIVAFVEGKPAGLVNVFEKGEISDIFLIAVLPQFQGRGVGRALIDCYESSLSPTISGLTVETQIINYAAQSLYARTGYQVSAAKHVIHFWL